MNEDKIIEVSSEAERRRWDRRREDRGERKWHLLDASANILGQILSARGKLTVAPPDSISISLAVEAAAALLEEIERAERAKDSQ